MTWNWYNHPMEVPSVDHTRIVFRNCELFGIYVQRGCKGTMDFVKDEDTEGNQWMDAKGLE